MHGRRDGFFRRLGGVKLSDLVDLVYEVAYFWKVSPRDLHDRTLDEVLEMKSQLNRLSKLITDIRI